MCTEVLKAEKELRNRMGESRTGKEMRKLVRTLFLAVAKLLWDGYRSRILEGVD